MATMHRKVLRSPLSDTASQQPASPDGDAVAASTGAAKLSAPLEVDAVLDELRRQHQLLSAVTQSIAELLTARSMKESLPLALKKIAATVSIDRMLVVEVQHRAGGSSVNVPYYVWKTESAPGIAGPRDILAKDSEEHRALTQWRNPLHYGQAVFASQRTGPPGLAGFLARLNMTSILLVPIMIHGTHWGQIGFDDCSNERDWTGDEIDTLKLFADVIGVAITRERSLEELQGRDALLHAVTASIGEIMTAADLRAAISSSLPTVAKALGADRMLVLETVSAASAVPQLCCRYSWCAVEGLPDIEQILGATAAEAEYSAWTAPLLLGQVIRASLSNASGKLKGFFSQLQLQSALVVPITVNAALWGQIEFHACLQEREWTAADVDILKTLAELIGTAIMRERYIEELSNANTIIQNSPTILYRLRGQPSLPLMYVSQNVAVLGYDPVELLNSPTLFHSYVHPGDRVRVQTTMVELLGGNAHTLTLEFRVINSNGESRWVENRYTPVRDADGRLIEVEGIMIDITERKAATETISRMARTDPLTGLANRATFGERLRQAFAGARRGAQPIAVLYLDLDRFKEVNDLLGHGVGDRLLRSAAERIRGITRESDIVARLGGDEFAVLQMDVADTAAAGTLAAKIVNVVAEAYVIDANELRVGVSVGVSVYSDHVVDAEALLAQADQALYRAKDEGRGQYRFHSPDLDAQTRERVALAEDLRQALARDELELYYQPQVELSNGHIIGMEALIRWNHRSRGLLLPDVFLPIAEKCGAMQALSRWVLDKACRQLRLWRDADVAVAMITVNVALAQIRAGREFVTDVKDTLNRWGLAPSDLELDVTEMILARTTLAQSNVLEELRQHGVRIAIDDFGTQYSSLDYLRTYRVNRLKIARSMVNAAADDHAGSAMLRAILSLAAELDIQVVAEGVETESQRSQLVNLCAKTQGQGHFFSSAMPAAEALAELRKAHK